MKRFAALVVLYLSAMTASAQQPAPPSPMLRAKLEPPTTVVGQATTLTIDVLAPNYMTKPPVIPEFQIRNAVTRPGSTVNLSEQVNGTTLAGVQYEFLIYPQEPGSYAISSGTVAITYASNPPETREATVRIPPLSFEAVIPDEAQALDPFVSAQRLAVRQEIKVSSDPAKVGDSVVRTVTIEADGTPAMLLPSPLLARSPGSEVYPSQPEFQDRYESRTGALVARRIDQVTYMLERAGPFDLPAIDIGWWNAREKKVEHATVNGFALSVAENPDTRPVAADSSLSPRRIVLFLADHLVAVLLLGITMCVGAWFAPRMISSLRDRLRRRREAYRQSEAFAYSKFRSAARRGDAGAAYFALLNWIAHFAPARSLKDFRAAARDAELDAELGVIESRLFGLAAVRETGLSPARLARRVAAARRRLRRASELSHRHSPLPGRLNPDATYPVARRRPVAR